MKILLVEDEKDLSSAIRRALELYQYSVDCAFDGEQGLKLAEERPYDIILLDLMLPKISGNQIVVTLRQRKIYTPILILTAKSETDDVVEGLDLGADDYLTKPFQFKELLARIRALTRRNAINIENLSFGNISIDGKTAELVGPKGRARLTATEYKLLTTLIQHSSELLSTEKLMDLVWNYDTQAEINVVWAYLSAVRKKLTEVGANVVIKAARGVGYRLVIAHD